MMHDLLYWDQRSRGSRTTPFQTTMLAPTLAVVSRGWKSGGSKTVPRSQLDAPERGGEWHVGRLNIEATILRKLEYGPYKEGIQQAREASEISERLGGTEQQAQCLNGLAWALHGDG